VKDERHRSDIAALEQLRATYEELDAWGLACRDGTWQPAAESELAIDDLGWPPSPLSQLARGSLVSAWDHLSAVRTQVESRGMFPFATPTLLRTALVASAQAVWLLGDDSGGVRQQRGRTLAAETYRRHFEYLRDLLMIGGEDDPNTVKVADALAERIGELATLREELGERSKWNATAMIEGAVRSTFAAEETPDALVIEARSLFRRGSGAAHGLHWSILGSADTTITPGGTDGLAAITAGCSPAGIQNAFRLAYLLSKRGWTLLDRRSAVSQ